MQNIKAFIDRYNGPLLLTALAIILFLLQRGEKFKALRDVWKARADFADTQFKQVTNLYGQQIAQQETAITGSSQQIKELSAQIFGLNDRLEKRIKEVQALVKIQQRFIIRDSAHAEYSDSTMAPGDSLVKVKDVIIPPRKFSVTTDSYTIAGTVNLKRVDFDSISIPNKIAIRIAEEKTGWFKPRKQIVQVINTNPYIETEGLQSMTLKPAISAWNRWIKPIIAAAITFFITTKLN